MQIVPGHMGSADHRDRIIWLFSQHCILSNMQNLIYCIVAVKVCGNVCGLK